MAALMFSMVETLFIFSLLKKIPLHIFNTSISIIHHSKAGGCLYFLFGEYFTFEIHKFRAIVER